MEAGYKRKLAALFVILMMVAAVWYKAGIYFETNDDKCITEILCGRMTGETQARTVYVSYLLALPISLLYRITVKVPWYGLTLILFQILAYTAVLESVWSRCRKLWERAAAIVFTGAVLLMNLYLLGHIQYTSTAGLLAAAGYFCLLVQADTKRSRISFWVLEAAACLLRRDAMLMIQPLGFLAVWGGLLTGGKRSLREHLGLLAKLLLPPMTAVLAVLAVDALVYNGSGWKAYEKYSDAQVVLFDYKGLPPYNEVRPILDRYQVSEIDYNAYAEYMLLDWVLPPDCAGEVAAYVQEQEKPMGITKLWETLRKHLFEESYWGLNRVLVILWASAVILALAWREAGMLLPALGLLAGKLFSWSFLLYRGRFPLRVSMPLLAGELLLLLGLLLRHGMTAGIRGNKRIVQYGGVAALLVVMCAAGFITGKQQYSQIRKDNNGQKIFMEGLREIRAYCNARPQNKYILDAVSMSYYRGSALECEIYGDSNYIVAGNWYANSPCVRRYHEEYLSGCGEFYFLVYDDGRGLEHPCVSWLMQETGVQPEVYERFTASHGGSYLVYQFEGVLY